MDEAWGERIFECIDPFGYVWEFSTPLPGAEGVDGFAAVRENWFGEKPG